MSRDVAAAGRCPAPQQLDSHPARAQLLSGEPRRSAGAAAETLGAGDNAASNAAAKPVREMAPLRSVPLLDLQRTHAEIREELLAAAARVLDSGRFLHGPDVAELEDKVARRCGVPAAACASGSDALLLALMALDIGPGDDVLVPSFTFFATAGAVWRLGAHIVFVDLDPVTFNLDPSALARAVTPRSRAVIPVHLFGQCADMPAILEIADRHRLHVVEDAAQALGAEINGTPAGAMGAFGCFSFYPTKNLGGFGDGGMLTARSRTHADRARLLAAHGMQPRYYHSLVGMNSRLDSLQAALLNVKWPRLIGWEEARRANAERYARLFAERGAPPELVLPRELAGRRHVWNQYTVRVPAERRDAIRKRLAERQVGVEIYYPVPLHKQECFRAAGFGELSLPETERACREVLSLPIFPGLAEDEQAYVVDELLAALR